MEENRFTALVFQGDTIVTGDYYGNVTRFSLEQSGHVAELIGNVDETIVDLVSHGLTTVALTASGKVYSWSIRSRRIGLEVELEVLEGELIHVIDSSILEDNFKLEMWGSTEVIIRFDQTDSGDWKFLALDLSSGSESAVFFNEDIFDYQDLIFDRDLVITRDKVYHRDSGEVCAEIHSAGEEYVDHSDDYGVDLLYKHTYKVNGIENCYAVVDYLHSYRLTPNTEFEEVDFDVSDESSEYCINIITIDPKEISINQDFFDEPLWVDGMKSEFLHFKFKEDDTLHFAFYKDLMATITDSGDIKVFNYEKKERLYYIQPPSKPETDEFGNVI